MILKRMKRRHSREDAIELCTTLKAARPDFTFGADIIAGFPTETAEMFENSKNIISEIGIPWLHVFPYSAREGTPAAKISIISEIGIPWLHVFPYSAREGTPAAKISPKVGPRARRINFGHNN